MKNKLYGMLFFVAGLIPLWIASIVKGSWIIVAVPISYILISVGLIAIYLGDGIFQQLIDILADMRDDEDEEDKDDEI